MPNDREKEPPFDHAIHRIVDPLPWILQLMQRMEGPVNFGLNRDQFLQSQSNDGPEPEPRREETQREEGGADRRETHNPKRRCMRRRGGGRMECVRIFRGTWGCRRHQAENCDSA